jgi:ankyrin repeat protein
MRIYFLLLTILLTVGMGLSQDLSPESILEDLEMGDTLDLAGEPSAGEYLADTIPFAGADTTYFMRGDPEYNLIRATEFSDLDVVRILIERGVDANASTYEGVTPLMFASQNGDVEIMMYLMAHGAKVNAKPLNDVTALIGAVRTGHYGASAILLDSGAVVDARDELNLTSLMHASAYNYPDIVELLIDGGARMENGDWFGTKPLMMASFYNCIESADVLLDKGADPDGKDKNDFTPLMVAVQHKDYDMAWLLLDKGADPTIQNAGGLHALAMAVMRKDMDMMELLLESGADINQNINSSTNSLSLAEESRDDELIAFLNRNGGKYNRKPEVSEIRGGLDLSFNGDDSMLGFVAGVSENKYNLYLTSGFLVRPSAIPILRPENDTLSFQLWEKRFMWPVSLGKEFKLIRDKKQEFGFRIHLTGALTWGSYRGSSLDVGPSYMVIPGAGMYWKGKNIGILVDYQYVAFKVHNVSPHRIGLSILGFYDFRSRIKHTRKDISWF